MKHERNRAKSQVHLSELKPLMTMREPRSLLAGRMNKAWRAESKKKPCPAAASSAVEQRAVSGCIGAFESALVLCSNCSNCGDDSSSST